MKEGPTGKKLRDLFKKNKSTFDEMEISGGMTWEKKDTDTKVWIDEVAKINNTFYLKFLDPNVKTFVDRLKEKYTSDPLMIEFCNKYMNIAKFLKEISEENTTDPLAKADYIYSRLRKDDEKMLKEFGIFSVSLTALNHKYNLFTSTQAFRDKIYRPTELGELERNMARLAQWLPKYSAHLEKVPAKEYKRTELSQRPTRPSEEIAKVFENFKKALVIYNENVRKHETLESVCSKTKKPFHSLFRRKNIAALKRIETCKASDIADFLVSHPQYAEAFLTKPRRDGRNFLDEFYKDPVSLEKMLKGPTELRDRVNAAYGYWPKEKPFPASFETSIAPLLKIVMPKVLRDALIQKIQVAHENGFPLPNVLTMGEFAKNLDNALKSAEGLSYKKFVGLLNTNQMNAVFNLDYPFFQKNADAFKAPARPAPAPRAVAQPRRDTPHRPSTH